MNKMNKIYIMGPSAEKRSEFIIKHFSDEIIKIPGLIDESDEMIVPKDFDFIYIILDESEESIEWQRFYFTFSNIQGVSLVKEF